MDDVWKGLTALIAASTLLVGLQQWWISREKLRLDLFEKRYAVFEAVRKFIARIIESSVVDFAWQNEYWRETVNTQFLFESDVIQYVDKVNKQASQLTYHSRELEAGKADLGNHSEARLELHIWFADQLRDAGLPRVFAPYLKFQDLRGPFSSLVERTRTSLMHFAREQAMAEKEKDVDAQLREIRANIFGSVFDRVVWLDAAAISAIFVALQGGYAEESHFRIIAAGIWTLCGSLAVTLFIAPYRAFMSARHQDTGNYRFVWESYIGQLIAAIATGVGVILAVAGFLCSVRGA